MSKLRVLDLFCGAGGASTGLYRAGFDVVGIDIKKQPRYPFTFIQADATNPPVDLADFDFVWASPPCQAHTSMKTMRDAKEHADLIPATRALLTGYRGPWCIENVPGAPLRYSVMLCGTMFGLGVDDADLQRHRLFETSFPMLAPQCQHAGRRVMGIYGEGVRDSRRKHDKTIPEFSVVEGRVAMGIDWMSLAELCQAIPPAYSEYIARAALAFVSDRIAA